MDVEVMAVENSSSSSSSPTPYRSRNIVTVQILRRAVEYESAVLHADDALAISLCGIQGMKITKDGYAVFAVDLLKGVHDDAGVARIKRRDRLIGQQQPAVPEPAPGQWPRAAAVRRKVCRRAAGPER